MKIPKAVLKRNAPRLLTRQQSLLFWIPGEPPTVTHHDKVIGRHGRGGRANLWDSPRLVAARQHYVLHLGQNSTGIVPEPPYALHVQFIFTTIKTAEPQWRDQKPDWDNAAKLIGDALAKCGWIEDDKSIARAVIEKFNCCVGTHMPGVRVRIGTLVSPAQAALDGFDIPKSSGLSASDRG